MVDRNSVWIVIPAYNEASVIADTLAALQVVFDHLVVVDDCSHDGTDIVALSAGAHVCRHPVNLGQGAALQTGIDFAIGQGAQAVVTFDADGQHQPGDAFRMFEVLQTGQFDVVLGSRFLGGTVNMPIRRRIFLKLAVVFTRITTGLKLTDTHNGIRVFTRAALQRFRIRHNRMAHASEILEAISQNAMRYTEVSVTVTYTDYSKAKGQKLSGAVDIVMDLALRKISK